MPCLDWLKRNSLLLLITVFGLALFTYKLSSIPSGVANDEAVVGYNAYSILETGKDEYGKALPILFKFYGSFTPGLFVYLATIPIKLFGLSIFSIRILSVISMIILGLVMTWFVQKYKLVTFRFGRELTLLTFMITPWVLFNARLGYETTLALLLLALGILFYQKPGVSFFFLSLSTYAGHTQRYLGPALLLLILFIFYQNKKDWKKLWWPLLMALVLQIPNIILVFTPAFWVKNGSFTNYFLGQYLSYFSPANLFYRPDYNLQRSIPELAVFYGWMFLPWVVGLYTCWQNRKLSLYRYILWLIFLCPLPAALGNVSYSTQRALPLLVPYFLVILVGVNRIVLGVRNKLILVMLGVAILFWSMLMLVRSYFILFPAQRAEAWDFGFEQVAQFIEQNPEKKFSIDNGRTKPYEEILFFLKYPPDRYQKENPLAGDYYSSVDFTNMANFGNIKVGPLVWKDDVCTDQIVIGDSLAISDVQAKEHSFTKVLEVKNKEGKVLFNAFQTSPWKKCKQVTNK